MSDEPVTRAEFDALSETVAGQGLTNRVLIRQMGEVLREVRRLGAKVDAIGRLLGVDETATNASFETTAGDVDMTSQIGEWYERGGVAEGTIDLAETRRAKRISGEGCSGPGYKPLALSPPRREL